MTWFSFAVRLITPSQTKVCKGQTQEGKKLYNILFLCHCISNKMINLHEVFIFKGNIYSVQTTIVP